MFEKEAEEYAVLNARQYIHNEDIGFCTSEEEVRQAYQKGAEFGYNKANKIKSLEEENAELKEKVSYLEDNLRVARKDRENLQLKVGKGLKEFIKDCPYSALKLYANGYYVEQLTKAKEIIRDLLQVLPKENIEGVYEVTEEAEHFLREVESNNGE